MRSDLIIFGAGSITAVILLIYIFPLVHTPDKTYTYADVNYSCTTGLGLTGLANTVSPVDLISLCSRANQFNFLSYVVMIVGGILLVAGLFLSHQQKKLN